jgi:glutamate dehydrogenase
MKDDTMFNKARNQIIEQLCGQLADPNQSDYKAFIRLFMERFPVGYIEKLVEEDLAGFISSVWEHFKQYDRTTSFKEIKVGKLSLHRTERIFLTLINIDRPYLIESLLAFFQKWDLKPQLLIHPVIAVERKITGLIEKIYEDIHKPAKGAELNFESVIFVQAKNRFTPRSLEKFSQQLDELLKKICLTVDDIPAILKDIAQLREKLPPAIKGKYPADEGAEIKEFLGWLSERYFVPLGARYFDIKNQAANVEFYCLEENIKSRKGLFLYEDFSQLDEMVPSMSRAKVIPDLSTKEAGISQLMNVVKTNQRSPIHRPSRIDSIEIMDWDETGKINGVYQLIGVFTKEIFNIRAFEIPYLRRKVESVFNQFNLNPTWYDGKSLLAILDSIPRDEMFYHSTEQLFSICDDVLELRDHAGLSVFCRPDVYGRYVTVMVFMTRERYSYALKERLGQLIAQQFKGKIGSSVAQVGDLPFARVIYVVEFAKPVTVTVKENDLQAILDEASLGWFDRLELFLDQKTMISNTADFLAPYRGSFHASYQEAFAPEEVYNDIVYMEKLSDDYPIDINIYRHPEGNVRVKIYFKGEALSLSSLLPLLNHFGLKVLSETTYTIARCGVDYHLHDFDVEINDSMNWQAHEVYLRPAFQLVYTGRIENDGFNQLILQAGLTVKQTNMIRAYVKFLLQAKLPYSQSYVEQTLALYPTICTCFAELFEQKFNPVIKHPVSTAVLEDKILGLLQNVSRLDHDRILRRILNALQATVRTNYYQLTADQKDKDYLSFKFDSSKLQDLPQPRPMFEVFVYSSTMEAIHLRGGKVARGGLRWSDRFEDYRSEVLGLMKAQMVKNSVIVPLGSKGGFVVKRHNEFTDRTELLEEVVRCYQTMIRGLLDITDNLINGEIVPPDQVVRYDEDDPYLVVAADKGTATFSDIANALSIEYGFWLDDAFASGGSAGYDHKKMAITSRGAWESVKRHFREMGIDVQSQPFTVAGVGDMSGDVFGNGLLRSNKTRLVAAFDHRHIFIDPDPDAEISYAERQRLFNLSRSSWDDYDKNLISKGGGVYPRTLKSVQLSDEALTLLGLDSTPQSPDDIIRAILQAPVDLLWFGGIGTYVKSQNESNADVGDNINAALRIDGRQVRAKVIGEGANLGMTQLARIEFALKGGRINTDAIDNSAGVDCSDHEVNIKVLFSSMKQKIDRDSRNKLLIEMTDNVAELVLRDNYQQTKILSVMQLAGKDGLTNYQNLIKVLESEIHLNRSIEFLPDDEVFERRRSKGQGLTRPELAVLLAYSKISLYNKIMESGLVELPFYHHHLIQYFPDLMQEEFKQDILEHPLRREIIATVLANALVNRVGPTFVYEMSQATNCSISDVVHAFFIAAEALELNKWWDDIDQIDDLMCADLQNKAYERISFILKMAVMRILGSGYDNAAQLNEIMAQLPSLIASVDQQKLAQTIVTYLAQNLPQSVAEKLGLIPFLGSLMDVAALQLGHYSLMDAGRIYFAVRSLFGLDWLQDQAIDFDAGSDWQQSAQLGLIDDVGQTIMALTQQVINSGYVNNIDEWINNQQTYIRQAKSVLTPLRATNRPDLGMLTFAVRQIQRMPQLKKFLCLL